MNPAESDRQDNGRFKQKLSDEQMKRIRDYRAAGWTCSDLGRKFCTHRSLISRICSRDRRKPFHSWDDLLDLKELAPKKY